MRPSADTRGRRGALGPDPYPAAVDVLRLATGPGISAPAATPRRWTPRRGAPSRCPRPPACRGCRPARGVARGLVRLERSWVSVQPGAAAASSRRALEPQQVLARQEREDPRRVQSSTTPAVHRLDDLRAKPKRIGPAALAEIAPRSCRGNHEAISSGHGDPAPDALDGVGIDRARSARPACPRSSRRSRTSAILSSRCRLSSVEASFRSRRKGRARRRALGLGRGRARRRAGWASWRTWTSPARAAP